MSDKFAKLFETESHGQVLCLLDTNDEYEPSVKFMFMPEELGVCQFALSFNKDKATDEDEQWDFAEKHFSKVDDDYIVKHVFPVIDKISSQMAQ